MDFFSQTYTALRGPAGQPQTASNTISRLAGRLDRATLLSDRRAAVLTLRGLCRSSARHAGSRGARERELGADGTADSQATGDVRQEIGEQALPGLIDVLLHDAEVDEEIAKGALDTLVLLCSASPESEDDLVEEEVVNHDEEDEDDEEAPVGNLGLKHTDFLLETPQTTQFLFTLLAPASSTHLILSTLKFIQVLVKNRRKKVQEYFVAAQDGAGALIGALSSPAEVVRNDTLHLLSSLSSSSPQLQKLLVFSGAYDALFALIAKEGGIDGGAVVQQALKGVAGLLGDGASLSFFLDSPHPASLPSMLLYPHPSEQQQEDEPAPQHFALQFWDYQKGANATLIVALIGALLRSGKLPIALKKTYTRFLLELGLASNAPTLLKTKSLNLLSHRSSGIELNLDRIMVTPYMPVPGTNGEEWDRLERSTTLDVTVELALHGEYNNILVSDPATSGVPSQSQLRTQEGLELRIAAVLVFEAFTERDGIREAIVEAMVPEQAPGPLLLALATPPSDTGAVLDINALTSTHIATILFATLVKPSGAGERARYIVPNLSLAPSASTGGAFFVPADLSGSGPPKAPEPQEDEEPQSLLQIITENLSLAFLLRSRLSDGEAKSVRKEYTRIIVAYLSLLSQWLWDDSGSVRDFLEGGGMGVLVDGVGQGGENANEDPLVSGLCAFLLGLCYEFCESGGEIDRSKLYPVLTRLTPSAMSARIEALRNDKRVRAIESPIPSDIVRPIRIKGLKTSPQDPSEGEIWFDFAFVEFWRARFYTIQKAISSQPNAPRVSSSSPAPPVQSPGVGHNDESKILISSLRDVIREQGEEIQTLKKQLRESQAAAAVTAAAPPPPTNTKELDAAKAALAKSHADLAATQSQLSSTESKLTTLQASEGSLKDQLDETKAQLKESNDKVKEKDVELEDLLVLLDEVNSKRRNDKTRMKEKGLEVSEDEEEDDEDDEDEDDDEE